MPGGRSRATLPPHRSRADKPFVISMPPPNVTGVLHLGHAIMASVEDMHDPLPPHDAAAPRCGCPARDHAGIATQNVVERELAKEGLTRQDLGREKFVERVWEWKRVYHARITDQQPPPGHLVRLGARALHPGRGPLARRARGLRAPLRAGPDLPRRLPGELVPALRHGHLRPGGGARGRGRAPLVRALLDRGPQPIHHRGHHAPRDDPGRYGRGRAPGRRALPRPGGPATCVLPVLGRAHPDHRRRGGGPRLWHRRGQGDAGPRPGGLRDRPAPQPAGRST